MKKRLICAIGVIVLVSMLFGCRAEEVSEEMPLTDNIVEIEPYTEEYDEDIQKVDVSLWSYYGDWIVGGDEIGLDYVSMGIDPKNEIVGGILTISEKKISFAGPKGTETLENPRYVTTLKSSNDFARERRASYESMGFHTPYVINLTVYDGEDEWHPFGVGHFWLKDYDSIIMDHYVYHELTRIMPELLEVDPTKFYGNWEYTKTLGGTDEDLVGSTLTIEADEIMLESENISKRLQNPRYTTFLEDTEWFKGQWKLYIEYVKDVDIKEDEIARLIIHNGYNQWLYDGIANVWLIDSDTLYVFYNRFHEFKRKA